MIKSKIFYLENVEGDRKRWNSKTGYDGGYHIK